MNRSSLSALAAGALFGIGLSMSGMTDARRVLGFLDVFGSFDPTLLFVLGGAVLTTMLLFRLVLRRGRPVLAERFYLSSLKQLDRRLIGGAAIFGIGWGIAGVLPGPRAGGPRRGFHRGTLVRTCHAGRFAGASRGRSGLTVA